MTSVRIVLWVVLFVAAGCSYESQKGSDLNGVGTNISVLLRDMLCLPKPKPPSELKIFHKSLINHILSAKSGSQKGKIQLQNAIIGQITENSAVARQDLKKSLEILLSDKDSACGGASCSRVFHLNTEQIDEFIDNLYFRVATSEALLAPENIPVRYRILSSLVEPEEGSFPFISEEATRKLLSLVFNQPRQQRVSVAKNRENILNKFQINARLSPDEIEEVRQFTLNGFGQIRSVQSFTPQELRALQWQEHHIKGWRLRAKIFDDAIKKIQVYKGTVYRGINNVSKQDIAHIAQSWVNNEPIGLGRNYRPAAASASTNQKIAQGFVTGNIGDMPMAGVYGVLFEIKTSRGAPIESVSAFKKEQEVILPSNGLYRIIRIAPFINTKFIYVQLIEIDPADAKVSIDRIAA